MYQKRDLELPRQRKLLMERIEEDLLSDDNILGVFYGGSIGANDTDLYSDIDLRIVTTEETYPQLVESKLDRARKWGDVLFFEQAAPHLNYTVIHYKSFIKVDCFYYRLSDLKPSVWFMDILIVKDHCNKLKELCSASETINDQPTIEEINAWRGKLFAYFHEAYRRIMKEEWSYAYSMFLGLKWLIAAGWYLQAGIQTNAFGDWSKVEGERSPLNEDQLGYLKNWKIEGEPEELLQVLNDMALVAKNVDFALCTKFNEKDQPDLFDEVMALIL